MGVKETGTKRTEDGRILCAKCGNDIEQGGAKFVAHMDGVKHYTNVFECLKCGAPITQEYERDEYTAW